MDDKIDLRVCTRSSDHSVYQCRWWGLGRSRGWAESQQVERPSAASHCERAGSQHVESSFSAPLLLEVECLALGVMYACALCMYDIFVNYVCVLRMLCMYCVRVCMFSTYAHYVCKLCLYVCLS